MSSIVYGNTSYHGNRNLLKEDLGYDYPEGLDLRPGSELHEKIKNEVISRAQESATVMSSRFESWNSIDKALTCYIPIDEAEAKVVASDKIGRAHV